MQASCQAVQFPTVTKDYAVRNDAKHGLGLVANRKIKKGEAVFCDSLEYTFTEAVEGDYLLWEDRNGKASTLTKSNVPSKFGLSNRVLAGTHGVPKLQPAPDGKLEAGGILYWQLECPGLLMNHSCDPNVVSKGRSSDYSEDHASRDINKGDELTCDYALQFYDEGALFAECHCGAATCRGEMMGFKALSDQEKERLLPRASEAVRSMYMADMGLLPSLEWDQPAVLPRSSPKKNSFRLMVPGPSYALAPVRVKQDEITREFRIYSLQDFSAGALVYEYWSQPWPTESPQVPVDMVFGASLTEGDPPEGTTISVLARECAPCSRAGIYMMTGWDLLTKHSCDPNICYKNTDEENDWRAAYAAKNITAGDKLTVDFNSVLWDRSVSTKTDFACQCGSLKCTGTTKGFKFLKPEEREERKHMNWKREIPPSKEATKAVGLGSALAAHVLANWREDPGIGEEAPPPDYDDSSSSDSECPTQPDDDTSSSDSE